MNPDFNYGWALVYIERYLEPNSVQVVAEVGSRDGLDAIALSVHFPAADVIVFEPDPLNVVACRANIQTLPWSSRFQIFDFALSDTSGYSTFYSIDPELYDNRGASSLFPIDFSSRPRNDLDRNRSSIQTKVSVVTKRFDELELSVPCILAIDVEGSELLTVNGFGPLIEEVDVIICETSFVPQHIGSQASFRELNNILSRKGFTYVAALQGGRASERIPRRRLIDRVRRRHTPSFDVMYVNNRLMD